MANAALNAPEDAPLNTYDDGGLRESVEKLEGAYKAFRVLHDIKKFISPWRYAHHKRMADRWGRGEDFLGDRFDVEYSRLTGAQRTVTETFTDG